MVMYKIVVFFWLLQDTTLLGQAIHIKDKIVATDPYDLDLDDLERSRRVRYVYHIDHR